MTSIRMMPLADVTSIRASQSNKLEPDVFKKGEIPSHTFSLPVAIRKHNPYSWKCLPDDEFQAAVILSQRRSIDRLTTIAAVSNVVSTDETTQEKIHAATPNSVCNALVQFKCHHGEYSSAVAVDKGQYVVVQGDRGIDVGVVVRVNSDLNKSYVERTGPSGSVLRHATQREVDYWATDLKSDEASAVDLCQQRVQRLHLNMEVRFAEYQFDKKKLTFYYDSKSRVDFVQLLKELYREYGCRIWMEKVRPEC